MNQQSLFFRLARRAATASGHPLAFMVAAGTVVAWAISGPVFHFDDTWQLAINTRTTIMMFLVVFLVQHSQKSRRIPPARASSPKIAQKMIPLGFS